MDQDTAIRYRVALRDAGALLDIRPHKSDTAQVGSNSDNQAEETLTLLPPNTGNLIDCAIAVTLPRCLILRIFTLHRQAL